MLTQKSNKQSDKQSNDKQRNYCLNLLRKAKQNYFGNIKISSIADDKKFSKRVKLLFSAKISHREITNLVKNDTNLIDDQVVADTFNN